MFSVRKANIGDCKFLAEVILLAESTGSEITSYAKMFDMTNEELLPIIEMIISSNSDGHPLTYNTYLIAEFDGRRAAAISIYKEGKVGDSNHLMTGALMTGFDRNKIGSAFRLLKQHAYLSIPKTRGTMQIDCVATLYDYRGRGLLKRLIAEAEKEAILQEADELQIQVWKNNVSAIIAYEKLGYKVVLEQLSKDDKENGKLLLTKKV